MSGLKLSPLAAYRLSAPALIKQDNPSSHTSCAPIQITGYPGRWTWESYDQHMGEMDLLHV